MSTTHTGIHQSCFVVETAMSRWIQLSNLRQQVCANYSMIYYTKTNYGMNATTLATKPPREKSYVTGVIDRLNNTAINKQPRKRTVLTRNSVILAESYFAISLTNQHLFKATFIYLGLCMVPLMWGEITVKNDSREKIYGNHLVKIVPYWVLSIIDNKPLPNLRPKFVSL